MEKRVIEAAQALSVCQLNFLQHPSSQSAILEKTAHMKWLKLALAEERFLQQRSRVNWLANGDSNTAFFHRMVAARRATNQIHYLIDECDNRIESQEDIADHCVSFYSNLLGGSVTPTTYADREMIWALCPFKCDVTMKNLLSAEVTPEEIKAVIFALPSNKSPGPDGYNSEFLKASWNIIGTEVTEAILEFFNSGQILKQWNSTAITLIPKKVNADKISDFRPISLCNVLYKVISKILAK